MSIQLIETSGISREEIYELVVKQVSLLISDEKNLIATLSNVSSLLDNSFSEFLWTGFYITSKSDPEELILGPFQGRPACTRIRFGKGVCGTSAQKRETIIVDNVDEFPGHIVCDSLSKSEIVVPIIMDEQTRAVIDVDSSLPAYFSTTDAKYLEKIAELLIPVFADEQR